MARERRPIRRRRARRSRTREARDRLAERRESLAGALPYLSLVRAPTAPAPGGPLGSSLRVATYNVHRWSGANGTKSPDPARAGYVISELDADVIALQEVLHPFDEANPLEALADALHLHLAFVATRVHRRGEVGNAILSRWPISSVFGLDLSFSRVERRSAVAAQFKGELGPLSVVATHLALVDRTRHRQVRSILEHPRLQGPVVLLGDMNAWRRCKATRTLEQALAGHGEVRWPRTFPAARPMLALDRVYARGARLASLDAHASPAARRASDHLPVVARLDLEEAAAESPLAVPAAGR